jgi:hypothetical protein
MHSPQQRAAWRAHNQQRRAAAAKAGICSTCLAREVEHGKAQCAVCRAKAKERRRT